MKTDHFKTTFNFKNVGFGKPFCIDKTSPEDPLFFVVSCFEIGTKKGKIR